MPTLTREEKGVVHGFSMIAAFKITKRFPELSRKVPWITMTIADTMIEMIEMGEKEHDQQTEGRTESEEAPSGKTPA